MKQFMGIMMALFLALSMVFTASAAPPERVTERGNERSAQNERGVQKYAHCHQIDGFANQGLDAVYITKYLPEAALNAGGAHGENTALSLCMTDAQIADAIDRGQVLDGQLLYEGEARYNSG